jgi:hypothetical protein
MVTEFKSGSQNESESRRVAAKFAARFASKNGKSDKECK